MNRYICQILGIGLLLLAYNVQANNVRVSGDVKVLPSSIVNSKMASFDVMVEWDNSWRDEFNYDAVYVFLKYRYNEAGEEWHHLYLGDEVSLTGANGDTYHYKLLNSRGSANLNEGILVYRNKSGFGKASVKLTLKWDITLGDRKLDFAAFNSGKVFLSAMALEMVYVPQGAFRAGDSQTGTHFHHKYMPIPEKWDVVSGDYRLLTKNNQYNSAYPPQFATNHMNDTDRTKPTNAWVGDDSADQLLCIDFGEANKKTIRYFAIESIPGYVPAGWELWGKNDETGADAVRLYQGTAADWGIDAHCAYPATKALEINGKLVHPYRFYEIRITNLGGAKGPAIRTIAMCEEDLKNVYDNSVLISEEQIAFTAKNGLLLNRLYTTESDMQAGSTTTVYPNGYIGFFAMKYEISQEQYVAFLNKLTLTQQVARTCGEKMVSLQPGQYVFGDDPGQTSYRNGIILAQRHGNTEPLVFANDLDPNNGGYNLDGDGQTLACNYLTPADMLAYADWAGLRPLSELEYEKLCRQPFPAVPQRGEFAWNSTIVSGITGLTGGTEGTRKETASGGNVNMGGVIGGPLRCGAFAKEASSQETAGAGYWGAMELSGNLAEIYYNLNTEGRKFSGIPRNSHGNGTILAKTGDSDINAGTWPINGNAFALRGGSFKSSRTELETSDRSRASGVYETGLINVRKEEVTFRLGCTMAQERLNNVLTLENGLMTTKGVVADTIWTGDDYLIQGDIPVALQNEYYTIAWYYSGDGGNTWDVVEGEHSKDLVLKDLRHINVNTAYKEYRYRCEIYSCIADAKSYQVIIRVVNNTETVQSHVEKLSVNVANASGSISIKSIFPVTPKWRFMDNPEKDVLFTVTAGKEFVHTPVYRDFEYEGTIKTGKQPLEFRYYYGTYLCPSRDTVWVSVIASSEITEDSRNVICGHPFRDIRDVNPKVYNTVAIGEQCWMVENMNSPVSGSRCYNNNVDNCRKYGRLYNWRQATGGHDNEGGSISERVQGVCPAGWHVPTNAEWAQMNTSIGKDGKKLRSPYWEVTGNSSGFSALAAGGLFYNYTGGPWATTAGINSRSGYFDQSGDTKANSTPRSWWWTSTSCPNVRYWATEYYAYNSSYYYNKVQYIPFYVRLDNGGNLQFNGETGWRAYGYVSNSIFCSGYLSGSNNASYQHLSWNDGNADALAKMRVQFFMSVRCMRDNLLQGNEK